MNGKVLIGMILFIAWFILGSLWWACPIWENCSDKQAESTENTMSGSGEEQTPNIGKDLPTGPLVFNWGTASPQTSTRFPAFRDSLIGLLTDRQKFEIIGTYYSQEPAAEGFENIGLARAEQIKILFINAGLDSSRILLGSMINPEEFDSINGNFVASVFNRKLHSQTIVEREGKNFTIFFPFASNQMLNDPAFRIKLDESAHYLKESGRKVILTGHTDAKGTDADNEKRGLDRANSIRNELMKRGVAISQIETRTRGERELIHPNQPDASENRRVEVIFPN